MRQRQISESFSEIPEITSNDRFVSVSISFISSIIFAAVVVSVFTIISVTASVRSSSSIRFPSYEKALEFYNSEEYKPVRQMRLDNSVGNVIIIKGV